jgi:hypothetical protein
MHGFSLEPFDTARWHARTRCVYEYWRSLERPQVRLPARAAFDAFEVPKALGWIWLNDIEREPFRLRCRLFGTRLAATVGVDITGQYLDQRPLSDPQRKLDYVRLRATAIDGLATWTRCPPILRHGDIWSEVESLMLPLANDGEHPDILLGVSVFYRFDGSDV